MVRVFWEVLKDLWNFVCHDSRDLVRSNNVDKKEVIREGQSSQSNNPLTRPIVATETKSGDIIGWSAFVKVDIAPYFSQPEISIDSKLGSLFYGDKVTVSRVVNNLAEVKAATGLGWVDAEYLTENPQQVFPDFESEHIYDMRNEQTIKLRRFIQDEALCGRLKLPLQSLEFVFLKLKQNQTKISWPPKRPRLPGSWKILLKGVKGVSMSLEPRTGSILEYAGDDGVAGFFGYVIAVHPDLSITLQSVGRVTEGEYRVEECTHDEWKEWRPVFISVT